MSYLLEMLGRGLLADLRSAFLNQLPNVDGEDVDTLQRRFAASPTSADLALRYGMACLGEVRLSEAQAAFEAARQLSPASVTPLLGLACTFEELGQLERALKYLNAAQSRDHNDPATVFAIGFTHERLGHLDQARQAYEHSVDLCPQLRNGYERLAAIALRNGDWQQAVAQYQQLAELEPGDLDVLLTLGNLYLQARQPANAVDQYQRALLIEPDNCTEAESGREVLQHAGALEEAIEDLEALVRKYPGIAPYHVQLGDLYVKVGDDARALEHYTTALATQPHFLEATVKLGTQHMRQGRYADAALSFNRAVELNDQLISAFVGLGVAQHDCGREQESLATFDLAASLEPSTTLLFSESMRLHLQAEQESYPANDELPDEEDDEFEREARGHDELILEALRRHEQALAETPNHADLHYRYGLLLRQAGRHGDATRAFREAVALNPTYAKALVKLAICLKEAGALDEAVETFQKALRLERGRMVDVHYELGLLFAQRSQFDLAAEQFEQAGVTADSDPSFRENLALALQNVGMVDRAAAAWQAMSELARDPSREMLTRREHILRDANSE